MCEGQNIIGSLRVRGGNLERVKLLFCGLRKIDRPNAWLNVPLGSGLLRVQGDPRKYCFPLECSERAGTIGDTPSTSVSGSCPDRSRPRRRTGHETMPGRSGRRVHMMVRSTLWASEVSPFWRRSSTALRGPPGCDQESGCSQFLRSSTQTRQACRTSRRPRSPHR